MHASVTAKSYETVQHLKPLQDFPVFALQVR